MPASDPRLTTDATPISDSRPGGDYNDMPYVSMPVVYSQPARLAALAAIHGLPAPIADQARVLEIGCASGGNIIPLAARFPKSRFLGIDLSVTHIEIGRQRIAALGLTNIELQRGDIADISFSGELFDYVICHGVFSWVPKAAQDAVLRICGEVLADNGIAAISYNVLPGWHLRSVIREICLRHVGTSGTPHQRVAKVRVLLEQLAQVAGDADPYGLLLRSESARIARRPGSYILGEFLTEHNTPCHFPDFLACARPHGLSYLCEADLPSSTPELFMPSAAARIRELAGTDSVAVQQYTDFFSGRTFRRSLLVRSSRADQGRQEPGPERARDLHFATRLRLESSGDGRRSAVFSDHRNRTMQVRNPIVWSAFARLGRIYPATATPVELTNIALAEGEQDWEEAQRLISEGLFKLLAAGRATVSSLPLRLGRAADPRPRVWAIARAEAETGQPWVSSLNHTSILLTPVLKLLLRHLDGSTESAELAARLSESVRCGIIDAAELQGKKDARDDVDIATMAAQSVARALGYCADNALLAAN